MVRSFNQPKCPTSKSTELNKHIFYLLRAQIVHSYFKHFQEKISGIKILTVQWLGFRPSVGASKPFLILPCVLCFLGAVSSAGVPERSRAGRVKCWVVFCTFHFLTYIFWALLLFILVTWKNLYKWASLFNCPFSYIARITFPHI